MEKLLSKVKLLAKAKWVYQVKLRKVIFLFQDIFKINILFSLSNDRKVIFTSAAFGENCFSEKRYVPKAAH